MKIIIGIATVAAVATAADAIWYTFGIQHTIVAGVVHGALLLTVVGGVLGSSRGRLGKGLPIGAVAGIGGAASYYVLILLMDGRTYGSAIPAAWVSMWLILAALDGRWLRAPEQRPWAAIAVRAIAAAVFAGLAFYFVMTTLWGPPPAAGRNYFVQFLAWAFAWTPGLIALTAGSGGATRACAPRAGSATALANVSECFHDILGDHGLGAPRPHRSQRHPSHSRRSFRGRVCRRSRSGRREHSIYAAAVADRGCARRCRR